MARRGVTEQILFRGLDVEAVVTRMDDLAAAADGARWINVGPAVDEDDVPTGSALFGVFSARGPVIPVGTWIPGHPTKRGYEHTSIGILHPTGRQAVDRLRDRGTPVPASWVVDQDHPKRGLVLYVPPEAANREVLPTMLALLTTLTPFPFGERWVASVHSPDRE
jgi:hypothetical protein